MREFLTYDPLAKADHEIRYQRVHEIFSDVLAPNAAISSAWLSLHRFLEPGPLSYWDRQTVLNCLGLLEGDAGRTAQALSYWSPHVTRGYDNLLRRSQTDEFEGSVDVSRARDLLLLANLFHPEYLRLAEHVWSNLLRVYWAVLKKGGVQGKFDLRGALAAMDARTRNWLVAGFDDRIRNAVAHGEVSFRGMGIQYGSDDPILEIPAFDFLQLFDELNRTSHALALGILLFVLRNGPRLRESQSTLPVGLLSILAGAETDRTGFHLAGAVESDFPATGKQLHLYVSTVFRSRLAVMLECCRLAFRLVEHGALIYSRYLFQIDQGANVSSLLMIDPRLLKDLLDMDAQVERLGEIVIDTPLLWYDESRFATRIRAYRIIFRTAIRLASRAIGERWRQLGIWKTFGRLRVRDVRNASAGGLARLHADVVLTNEAHGDDRQLLREIARAAIRQVSRHRYAANEDEFAGTGRRWRYPSYVWVSVYRRDGAIRWLQRGGWRGGNLVAQAEKVVGWRRPPILVRNAEENWKGIRFRYGPPIAAGQDVERGLERVPPGYLGGVGHSSHR